MGFDLLKHSSAFGLLGLVVSMATVGMALAYAFKPTEHRLALLRPLSLAAIFGGLTSLAVGLASVLRSISAAADSTPISWQGIAAGLAESMLGLFIAFSCLTITWLLVTLGLSRN